MALTGGDNCGRQQQPGEEQSARDEGDQGGRVGQFPGGGKEARLIDGWDG